MFERKLTVREFLRLVLGGRYVEPTSAMGELIQQIEGLQERIIDLERLLEVRISPTFFDHNNKESSVLNRLFKLASTLGYEYKEETKEAGWVKKRLLENVTTNVSPGGSGCTGGGAGESMFTSVPDKTDAEYAEEFMKSDKHGNSGYPIIIRLPKTKKPKKSKSK